MRILDVVEGFSTPTPNSGRYQSLRDACVLLGMTTPAGDVGDLELARVKLSIQFSSDTKLRELLRTSSSNIVLYHSVLTELYSRRDSTGVAGVAGVAEASPEVTPDVRSAYLGFCRLRRAEVYARLSEAEISADLAARWVARFSPE
jgi:hypothetical protein